VEKVSTGTPVVCGLVGPKGFDKVNLSICASLKIFTFFDFLFF
jgi:hypothetical protein